MTQIHRGRKKRAVGYIRVSTEQQEAEALQTLRDVAVVALDKTGTLTKGRPELTDLTPSAGFERDEVLALVAAVEAKSEHPIAAAIVAAAKERGLRIGTPEGFDAVPGYGVAASVGDRHVAVGADRYMLRLGHDVTAFAGEAARLGGEGNAIALSRETIRNIKHNLFWAFAYNAALIPVAAGVLYPVSGTLLSPVLAAGAMALSSVFVLSNALRLKTFKPALAQEVEAVDDGTKAQTRLAAA